MPVPRHEPSPSADERTTLVEFLDYYRATIEQKVDGIDDAQSRATIEPSDLSLLGIVRHLAEVERGWFRARFLGEHAPYHYCTPEDIDGDWHPGPDATLAEALATYRAECARAREIAAAASLDDLSKVAVGYDDEDKRPVSMRWILVHMIEETARHAGHADLLRERVDGVTGD
jgi:uncharacterized damage-inducible protein DinB